MKKEIEKYCKDAIENMKNNKAHLVGAGKHQTHLMDRDIHQRTDEICLLYSYFMDVSFNKAKKELDCEDLFVIVEHDALHKLPPTSITSPTDEEQIKKEIDKDYEN